IIVDDKITNDYIDYIKKGNGTPISLDISDENSMIYGEFKELDENGSILEGGLSKSASLSINSIKDDEEKKKIIGLKKEDTVIININKVTQNEDELAALFNIDKPAAEKLKSEFQFIIKTISGWEKAEINQELFDKIYGKGKINSEKDFMSKIEQEISAIMKIESEKKLINDIIDNLIEKTNIPLPDEFLKKWMVKSSKEPVTLDQINQEYDN
ncbi:MAG: hypothetical protein IIA49_14815, partial [Bacteroidetes bacterium]|nr:hypothetical protein [Bacteroidota bacterium]